nr:hypothetical protein TnSNPV_127 [Trichoplusia ni single nucleopolyhedrovirus]
MYMLGESKLYIPRINNYVTVLENKYFSKAK